MFLSKTRKAFLLGLVFYSVNVPTLLCMEQTETDAASQATSPTSQEAGKADKVLHIIVGAPLNFVRKNLLQPAADTAEKYGSRLFSVEKISETETWTKICNWLVSKTRDAAVPRKQHQIQEVLDDIQDVYEADSESDEQDNPPSKYKKLWALFFITISVVPHFSEAALKIVPQAKDILQQDIRQQIVEQYQKQYPPRVFAVDPKNEKVFDPMQYDVCHDKSDGTTQCCKVHNNVLIECCRFIPNKVTVCGFIVLTGTPEESYHIKDGKIEQEMCSWQNCEPGTWCEWKKLEQTPVTTNENLYLKRDCAKLLNSEEVTDIPATTFESEFPVLYNFTLDASRSAYPKNNAFKTISIAGPGSAKYLSSALAYAKREAREIVIMSDPLRHYCKFNMFDELRSVFAHEGGHLADNVPLPIYFLIPINIKPIPSFPFSIFHYITIKIFENLFYEPPYITIIYNREHKANILAGLSIENPKKHAQLFADSITLFIDGPKKRVLENENKYQICEFEKEMSKATKEFTEDYSLSYKSAMYHLSPECEIPLLLELHEKYGNLDQQLEERARIELLDE